MRDLDASLAAVDRQHAEGCVKIHEDLARYQTVIDRVQPDVIVESGAFSGKSALWFARTAGCTVVTIDVTPCIDLETRDAWDRLAADGVPIYLITANTTGSFAVDAVTSIIAGTSTRLGRPAQVLVSLDSDHSAGHVTDEIDMYAPMVTAGSYLVVEDGLLRWMPDEERRHYTGNPLDAIEAFLAGPDGEDWEIDIELEDQYPVTQHPTGWLRRRP